jgi:hypothetical protein
MVRSAVAANALKQQLCGSAAYLCKRLPQCGDGWVQQPIEVEIVETNQSDILRNAHAQGVQCLDDLHGAHVVRGEQSLRPIMRLEECLNRGENLIIRPDNDFSWQQLLAEQQSLIGGDPQTDGTQMIVRRNAGDPAESVQQ